MLSKILEISSKYFQIINTGINIACGCGATRTLRVVTQSGLYDAVDGAANGSTTRATGRLRTRAVVVRGERESCKGDDQVKDHCVCVVVWHANDVRVAS